MSFFELCSHFKMSQLDTNLSTNSDKPAFFLPLCEIKDSLFQKLQRILSGKSSTVITENCICPLQGVATVAKGDRAK